MAQEDLTIETQNSRSSIDNNIDLDYVSTKEIDTTWEGYSQWGVKSSHMSWVNDTLIEIREMNGLRTVNKYLIIDVSEEKDFMTGNRTLLFTCKGNISIVMRKWCYNYREPMVFVYEHNKELLTKISGAVNYESIIASRAFYKNLK